MTKASHQDLNERTLLESRLAYHLGCLREDASDPAMTTVQRLAVVRERAARIRDIRHAVADLQKNG